MALKYVLRRRMVTMIFLDL